MKRIQNKIEKTKLYKKAFDWLKTARLSKSRTPVFKIVQVLIKKFEETNEHQQASSIAFSFTLSLFPTLLFLFSILPFIAYQLQIPNLSNQVLSLLKQSIPLGIYDFVAPTIIDILNNPRGDLLSFSFFFALYAATSGVVEMMNTFNLNYKYSEKRNFIKKRLIAMGLAFLFAFLLIFAVAVIIVGQFVLEFFREYHIMEENFLYYLFIFLRYIVSFLVFYIGISIVYYVAPAATNQWRFFSVGSTIASILVIFSTYGFSFYLSNFAAYNKLYGSIGTIIALMIWFYLLAWILLLGFTLNASISEAKIAYDEELKLKMNMLTDVTETGN